MTINDCMATGHVELRTIPGRGGNISRTTLWAGTAIAYFYTPERTLTNTIALKSIEYAILVDNAHHILCNTIDRCLEKRRCSAEITVWFLLIGRYLPITY